MRILLCLALTLISCTPPPEQQPTPKTNELQIPTEHVTDFPLQMYVRSDGTFDTTIDYALDADYPKALTITPSPDVYVITGCATPKGTATWTRIANVTGTAAALSLSSGQLSVTLSTEGTVTAVLEGDATGIDCAGATTLPLRHTLTIHVRRVTGFVVDQLHQSWPGCEEKVVIPAEADAWMPEAHPLDGNGVRFDAANAPKPVAMTLRSDTGLARGAESWQLIAAPGHVTVSLDTTRPVQGLSSFEVVAADALTRVDAKLVLRKAASKGSVTEELSDGQSYQLFYPEKENLVDLEISFATSTAGQLCKPIPGEWLSVNSSTPGQCGPTTDDEYGGGLAVAKIQSLGECRLEVTIPNTTHRWATSFTTR